MLFTPIIIGCLIANPTQCAAFMGSAELTESACMMSLTTGLDYMNVNRPDIYAAGLVCVETHLQNEEASTQ